MRAPPIYTLIALAVLTGCAAVKGDAVPSAGNPGPAQRGMAFVERACAGCHAVGASSHSPQSHAPPFWWVGQQVEADGLKLVLAELAQHGHVEMPPIYMTPDEIEDIAAYIGTLQPPISDTAATPRRAGLGVGEWSPRS